jgi:hypothetical protein
MSACLLSMWLDLLLCKASRQKLDFISALACESCAETTRICTACSPTPAATLIARCATTWRLSAPGAPDDDAGGTSVDDEVREKLIQVIEILTPYAKSKGSFHNLPDLRNAIALADEALERAELLANHRLPPMR